MRIAFVMDPLDNVDVDADTTFAIMVAAQTRGHQVYYVRMQDMSARGDECWTDFREVTVQRLVGNHFEFKGVQRGPMHEFDCIFMRKDPPFDIAYLHAAHLLELAEEKGALVMNRPAGLRAANEKLYSLHFPDAIPRTVVTKSADEIRDFAAELGGKCIIKPLDGHGGEGVLLLDLEDRNVNALLEMTTKHGTEFQMCQQYLPEARLGDKRIIMLNGEPLGGVMRVPTDTDHRGNIHVGGQVEKSVLTPRDIEIAKMVGPRLKKDGLWFVGLDVIGDYLTEVNVTSPTGIQEMSRLDGVDYSAQTVAWIESQIA